MDAIRLLALVSLALFTFSCAQNKTSSSVFPGTQGLSAGCQQQALQNRFIVQWEDGTFSIETDEESAEHFRQHFVTKHLQKIKHVDHDFQLQLRSQQTASALDSSTPQPSASDNWGQQIIGAKTLWDQNFHGQDILVGVVDGMVDVNHNQLQNNIYINSNEIPDNGIDDDNNGFIDDYKGIKLTKEANDPMINIHGSHVAGIIAADISQGGPIHGVADQAKIIPAQFIGNNEGGNIADAIIGIQYVIKQGAKIINLSWGATTCNSIPNLQDVLAKASNQGVLIVTAAGNGDDYGVGLNNDVYPSYPSAYNLPTQINVAASTQNDYLTSFSNFGTKTVQIAAPGKDILSTTPGNTLTTLSGTSMAAPMVSGAAALLWGAVPQATAVQIRQAILSSVDVIAGHPMEVSTRGRIDVARAYEQLKKLVGP